MAFSDRLREKSAAIAQRWQSDALATYGEAACRAFHRQQDPFANPVGHALRTGTRAAVEGLAAGRSADQIAACLDEIIKIRAVQEFEPSGAIAFVFALKDILRAELGQDDLAPTEKRGQNSFPSPGQRVLAPLSVPLSVTPLSELADLERQIDRIALAAFDIYMRYRGQICELRISEVKRAVGR